jgi:Heavy metal associated domain 2
MTKLKFDVAHQVPGRVRMKVAAAKGNPELLKQIADTFAVIPGIERITVNPATGSVVMFYDIDQHHEFHGRLQDHAQLPADYCAPRTEIDDLATKIEEEAEFLARHSDTARAIVNGFKAFDREIRLATDNNVDLKIVLALGIIGVTVLEVGAAAATPVWVTLSLFALNHVIEMHTPQAEGAPAGAPVVVKNAVNVVGRG